MPPFRHRGNGTKSKVSGVGVLNGMFESVDCAMRLHYNLPLLDARVSYRTWRKEPE